MADALRFFVDNLEPSKLLDWNELIERRPEEAGILIAVLAGIFAVLLIATIPIASILGRLVRTDRLIGQLRNRWLKFVLWVSLVGLTLIFFRWQRLPYFSSRIWLLLWVITAVIWFAVLIRYGLQTFPKLRKIDAAHALRERYLPKPKKS